MFDSFFFWLSIIIVFVLIIAAIVLYATENQNKYIKNYARPIDLPIIKESKVTLENFLGQGAYGTVQEALYDGMKYAAKTFNGSLNVCPGNTPCMDTKCDDLMEEATKMDILEHKNITALNGVMVNKCYILLEFMNHGPLYKYVNTHGSTLTLEKKHFISYEIASGLKHMHSKNYVHLDLHLGNVLVGEENGNLAVKISDLGLAKCLTPEDSKLLFKVDVNYFGNLVAEIYSRGYDMVPDYIATLVNDCTNPDQSSRPSAEEICKRLEMNQLQNN